MLFVCQTRYDEPTLKEFNNRHMPQRVVLAVLNGMLAGILFLLAVLLLVTGVTDSFLYIVCAVVIGVACCFVVYVYTVGFRKTLLRQVQMQIVAECRFDEEGVVEHITHTDGNGEQRFAYSAVRKVTESDNAYYLYVQKNAAVLVCKHGFTEGAPQDFIPFLRKKLPPDRIKIK